MTKISSLTEISSGVDVDADFLPIVDTSATTTKKVKPKKMLNGFGVTKGNILSTDGTDFGVLGVGSNNQVLTADSAQTYGVKWATPSTGGQASDMVYPLNTTIGDYTAPNAATATSTASASGTLVNGGTGGTRSLGGGGGTITRVGQSFATGFAEIGNTITSVKVKMHKIGSPSGNGTCKAYDSGGTLKATSTNTKDWSTLTGTPTEFEWTFAGFTLANGDRIVIGDGTFSNGNEVQIDGGTTAQSNTAGCYYTSSWTDPDGTNEAWIGLNYNSFDAANVYDTSTSTLWKSASVNNPAIYVDLSGSARDIASIALNIDRTATTETQIKVRCSTDTTFTDGETVRLINISDFTDDTWRFIPINRLAADCRYVQVYGVSNSVVLAINEIKVYYSPTTTDWNRKHFHKYLDPTSASATSLDSN